jgi:hypothetical protein
MCERKIAERPHLLDFDRTAALLENPNGDQHWWGLQTLAAGAVCLWGADLGGLAGFEARQLAS